MNIVTQGHLMINVSPQRANSVGASSNPNLLFIPSTNLHHLLPYNVKLQYQQQDVLRKHCHTLTNKMNSRSATLH
jgi:hypothetical protein